MFTVYILFSKTKSKFYVGQTNDLEDRLRRHNSGESISTKGGIPWRLVYSIETETRSEAMALELKIKKRGAARYLKDINHLYDL